MLELLLLLLFPLVFSRSLLTMASISASVTAFAAGGCLLFLWGCVSGAWVGADAT